jgi:hypothetical protein
MSSSSQMRNRQVAFYIGHVQLLRMGLLFGMPSRHIMAFGSSCGCPRMALHLSSTACHLFFLDVAICIATTLCAAW